MTALDRFDPFERRIGDAIDEIAAARVPDYLDDILQLTARSSQRPRWTFFERWLPVDSTLARPMLFGRSVPMRTIIALVAALALIAATAFYVGTQKRLPAPYGPAGNGQVIYGANGDLYVRDSLTSEARLLLASGAKQSGVIVSPDGQLVAYDSFLDGDARDPYEWVVNIDGSNPRQVLDRPYTFESFEWAPDSRSIAIVTRPGPVPELWIAPADGSGARQLKFESFVPWGATWDPIRAGVLLVRGQDRKTGFSDLYYVTSNGAVLQKLGMTPLNLNGAPHELSGMTFSPDGSGARQLKFESFVPWGVTWDPTRSGVLLVRGQDKDTGFTDLYYVTSDGAVLQKFGMTPLNLNGPAHELSGMTFSPDGSTIAYNSIEAVEAPFNRFRAHVMNRDGTNDRALPAPMAERYSQAWPAFSPDGTWVLLSSWETQSTGSVQHRLAIAPADGSAPARLIGPILVDENQLKSWSPDGSRILLCACDRQEIYSVDPVTGDFEKLPWGGDAPGWQRLAR